MRQVHEIGYLTPVG